MSKKFELDIIPQEVRDKMLKSVKARETDMIRQIALLECGISIYKNEKDLCDEIGVSRHQLEEIKNLRRDQIEDFKRNHKEGKGRIINEVNERLKMIELLRVTMNEGNSQTSRKLINQLNTLEKIVPTKLLKEMLELIEDASGTTAQNAIGPTQINIVNNPNNNPAIIEAERLLAERRSRVSVVDVTPVKENNP